MLKAIEKDPSGATRRPTRWPKTCGGSSPTSRSRHVVRNSAERFARWARHHPGIAILSAVLTATLLLATVGSLVAAGIFARQALRGRNLAIAERLAREEASRQASAEFRARTEADQARAAADDARAAAQAETYRATLSEVKALRAGHQLGWRDEALADLARLAVIRTPRRDLVELRSEAVASIGEFGVKEVARLSASGENAYSLSFSPDSRILVTNSNNGDLDYWDVTGRKHLRRFAGVARGSYRGQVLFLPDGDLAFLTAGHRVSFLADSGRHPLSVETPKP